MSGIVGMGTTYNLPNYVGELFGLSRATTPFLSAIGGLSGGKSITSKEWEWETYDLRDPSAERQRLEGATAPTAENRVRSYGRNVVEIHQEKASVSYTKQAATGAISTVAQGSAVPGSNAVTNELSWQIEQALIQIARDVNLGFMVGQYNLPTDNTTVRKTRGLLPAIQTNRTDKSTVSYTAFTSATDTITGTHALAVNDKVIFDAVGAATGIVPGRVYFVQSVSTTVSFKVSKTLGGAAITVGTATGIALHRPQTTALVPDTINDVVQAAYDNGGLVPETAVLMVNSSQKRRITAAYQLAYGNSNMLGSANRNVGGVTVDTILTDFGTLGIMLEPYMPQDAIAVANLGSCQPVFLDVPGKGHMFQEPLAKTGASDEVQIYGEVGLEYGNEASHALLQGLAV